MKTTKLLRVDYDELLPGDKITDVYVGYSDLAMRGRTVVAIHGRQEHVRPFYFLALTADGELVDCCLFSGDVVRVMRNLAGVDKGEGTAPQ